MIKRLLFVLVSLTLVMSGFPATASTKSDCPMAKMMNGTAQPSMTMDCNKATQDMQSKQSGCCHDMGCKAQCSAATMTSVIPQAHLGAPMHNIHQSLRVYPADAILASHRLNTQDRPPKSLA